jgi:hypothetical protein
MQRAISINQTIPLGINRAVPIFSAASRPSEKYTTTSSTTVPTRTTAIDRSQDEDTFTRNYSPVSELKSDSADVAAIWLPQSTTSDATSCKRVVA